MQLNNNNKILEDSFAIWIILAGLFTRVIASAFIGPGFDEAYYGVYSYNLAGGYFDHPPLVALIAGFGRWLTTMNTALTLRLGAILIFIPTNIVMYKITAKIYGRDAARISVILMHIVPFFLIGIGAFVIPDNSLIFFWLLTIYTLLLIKETKSTKYYILLGVSLGFSMLSKYHSGFLFMAIGILVIFYKDWNFLLKSVWFYISIVIAFIIFSPNIIWNYNNEWISYLFQFGKGGSGGMHFSLNSFLQGVFVQAGYLLPWNMILFIAVIVKTIRHKKKEVMWLLPFAILPILIFTLIGATRQILPHWPMPGYFAAVIPASGILLKWSSKWKKIFYIPSITLIVVTLVILIVQALTGILPLEKKADLTLDGQGWKEVLTYLDQNRITNDSTFLVTNKWFTSGELYYADDENNIVTILNKENPHGFSFWTHYDELEGKTGIIIVSDRYNYSPKEEMSKYFESIFLIDSVVTKRLSNDGQKFLIWKGKHFKNNFHPDYGARK